MNSKSIVIMMAAMVVLGGIGGLLVLKNNNDDGNPGDMADRDAVGRKIVVPENLDGGIVTIGSSGPLRFASMFDVFDNVIEVDKGDITDSRNGRAYSYAYNYKDLNVDTQSHPDNKLETETVESIAKRGPSLVITTEGVWNGSNTNFEILAKRCNIVVLKNQQMNNLVKDGELADYFSFNVSVLGKVFKKESRATEILDGVKSIARDIGSLAGASDGKKVYVAGVTYQGSNPLNTTFPNYLPFTLNGVKNAYNGTETGDKIVLKVEDMAGMDIDMVVVDPSSSDKISAEDSQKVLEYFYGINNDEDPSNDVPFYITVPIVWDSINYDCALASAYYIEHLVYGSLTIEQVKKKINGIFQLFYGVHGKDVLKDMAEFFVDKSAGNGQEMPILEKVSIDKNGEKYSFSAIH